MVHDNFRSDEEKRGISTYFTTAGEPLQTTDFDYIFVKRKWQTTQMAKVARVFIPVNSHLMATFLIFDVLI